MSPTDQGAAGVPSDAFYWVKPVLVAAAINALVILVYVGIYSNDFSSLVCADREKIGQPPFEKVRVGFGTQGFDGQYYYVLARNPWQRCEGIDLPSYRHSRIVYPAVAWLFSAGDPRLLLYVLPIINWLALVGLARLGTALAQHYGRSPWWGCLLPFALNATAPALRDLTDPVAMLTGCSIVAAWLLRWRAWTFAPLCTLAVLSREQNLLIVLLVLLDSALNRRLAVAKFTSIAVVIWVGWVCLLRGMYGEWPMVGGNTEPPFAGMWYRLQHVGEGGIMAVWVNSLGLATLALQIGCCLALTGLRGERLTCLLALGGVALAVIAGTSIYLNVESITRVFWWMPFAVWLWSMQTKRIWPVVLILPNLIWPCYALAQAAYKVSHGKVLVLG